MTLRRPFWLSSREKECIALAAQGYSDREIGRKLELSDKTVNEYIERVKRKLDVQTRIEAIVSVVRAGLIDALGLTVIATQLDQISDVFQCLTACAVG